MRSIALVGLAGVGKDTLAAHIAETYGHRVLSIAVPLKRIVQQIYQFSDAQLFGPSRLRNEPDPRYPRPDGSFLCPREALELFGTEAGRRCYERTWLDMAMTDAKRVTATGGAWVFTDARYANEMEACRAKGAAIVRLTRQGVTASEHQSEREQAAIPDSNFDLVLSTDGTIEETRAAFDGWYAKL